MTPKQALGVLVAAFLRREGLPESTAALYLRKLADIPAQLLEVAVDRLVETTRFFPSVAEIRSTAAAIAGLLPASPEEALAIVRKADVEEPVYRRDVTYADTERFWVWPPETPLATIQTIKRALARVGDPVGKGDERVFGWERDFGKVYEAVAAEETHAALADLSRACLPVPLRKALPEGVQGRLPAPRAGESPCGYHSDLGGRHRPDCPHCAEGAASGASPELEALPAPADVAENLAKVHAIVADLGAKKALRMGEALAAGGDGKDRAS